MPENCADWPAACWLATIVMAVNSLPRGQAMELLDAQGEELFGKKNFMKVKTTSRSSNREFFLNVTINLKGAPIGAYELRLTIKDLVKKQEASATVPVRLALAQPEKK